MVDVAAAYDARADEYIELLGSVEQMSEEDRDTIGSWGRDIVGAVLDAGCGPGHWSDLLAEGGRRQVVGVDGSRPFIASARQRFPGVEFVVGDLGALPVATGSVAGLLSWFSIIHTAPDDVLGLLEEFARVLTPGGSILLGFFAGEAGARFDHAVTTAHYWSAEALGSRLTSLGFVVERTGEPHAPGARRHGELVTTLAR